MNYNNSLLSLSILIILGMIWGTGYSIARFAMTHDVPPLGYSFWQSLGPAIIISIIVLLQKKKIACNFQYAQYYFISGLTGIVIPNTTMYFAAPHLPAGILAVIVNVVPIIAYPMAIIMQLEKFDYLRLIGILLALIGLGLIMLPKSSLPSSTAYSWALLTLIAPISFAVCSIYVARYRPKKLDSLTLSAGMLIASSLTLLPIVIAKNSFYLFHIPLTLPDWVIVLEIILSSIGYILFFQLIKIAGPVYYNLVDTIVVLTGLFWGFIIFNEHLNFWTSAAVCLIIIALILVTQRQRIATSET